MTQPNPITPVEGDLLLFSGDWKDPLNVAIMARTHSQFVHVAVVTTYEVCISARSEGIVATPWGSPSHVVKIDAAGLVSRPSRLDDALAWLRSKVGQPYGWADIANQALMLLGKDAVLLDKSYDCSHLACCFLWILGVELEPWMIDAEKVAPGDIARWAEHEGLLEEYHG